MRTGQIAVRYARALFLSAKEKDALDPVRTDMELLLDAASKIPEIRQLLESPIASTKSKIKALQDIFTEKVSPLSLDFLRMVTTNKREEYLPGMARHFIRLYKEEIGIQVATLFSAVSLAPDSLEQIREMIKNAFKSEIELEEELREDLIGGFMLRVEDKQLDASVKGKLARIKKELQK